MSRNKGQVGTVKRGEATLIRLTRPTKLAAERRAKELSLSLAAYIELLIVRATEPEPK